MPLELARLIVRASPFLLALGLALAAPALAFWKPEAAPTGDGRRYEWVSVNPKAPFAPRDGAGALSFDGRMWLLGGWNPGDKQHFPRICNNEVWSSREGSEWRLDKPNTFLDGAFDPAGDWEGRHTAGYVVHRKRMWIVGGDVNQGHYQSDVWSSADGKTWKLANPGQPVPWGPRALHYTVAFKDWIWIIGGGTYDTPRTPARNFYNDVWSSADGVRWTQHTAKAPWAPRQYHDVAVWDGRLWVLEGYAGANRNDVWYSPDGVNWQELPGTPWKPRHAASVFVHSGSLWMVAGNNMESDVWKLERRK